MATLITNLRCRNGQSLVASIGRDPSIRIQGPARRFFLRRIPIRRCPAFPLFHQM